MKALSLDLQVLQSGSYVNEENEHSIDYTWKETDELTSNSSMTIVRSRCPHSDLGRRVSFPLIRSSVF